MKHTATALNFATLLIGILLGYLLAQHVPPPAVAQTKPANIEEVTPAISAGSAAFGTLLAGRLAADEIAIKGVDLIKLQENLLNLLASKPSVFPKDELQRVIDRSRADKVLRLKGPDQK